MKTEAFQTPAESTEAEIQKGRLEKARKEAEYYRAFLKYVNEQTMSSIKNLMSGIKDKESLKDEDRTIGFLLLESDLDTIVEEAKIKANEKTNYNPENEFVDLKILKEMKPYEFIDYLEKLESSLVK